MNDVLATAFQDNGKRRVCFQSLTEMLRLNGDDIKGQALAQRLGLGTINHHISQVQINDDAELCRRLLMEGFKANTAQLRARILAQDPATLALYRGFSRFMLEDLENNLYTSHLSKSQRRKLSSKVAFEMIEVRRPHHDAQLAA
jgi:pyoverdine/dityrosine biosynthesis protein Dit1